MQGYEVTDMDTSVRKRHRKDCLPTLGVTCSLWDLHRGYFWESWGTANSLISNILIRTYIIAGLSRYLQLPELHHDLLGHSTVSDTPELFGLCSAPLHGRATSLEFLVSRPPRYHQTTPLVTERATHIHHPPNSRPAMNDWLATLAKVSRPLVLVVLVTCTHGGMETIRLRNPASR